MKFVYLQSIIILLFNLSCGSRYLDRENIISHELIGYNTIFQDTIKSYVLGTEVLNTMDKMDYKLISYINTKDCVPCELRLQKWNEILKEFSAFPNVQIGFLMLVNTKEKDEVFATTIRDNYKYPVAVSKFSHNNKIDSLLTAYKVLNMSFLLDSDNNVLLVGDVLNNPKTKNKFFNFILDDFGETRVISDLCNTKDFYLKPLGIVENGDTVKCVFRYYNNKDVMLHLLDCIPSCSCISAKISNNVVMPKDNIALEIFYRVNSSNFSFKHYIDVFFEETEKPCRFMLQGYINHK